jgi:4a-hydroxytetrahydrobiopterin dehydratase
MSSGDLLARHCTPCAKGTPPLGRERATGLLDQLHPAWTLAADDGSISRLFRFRDYYQTIAFVNALAWIAHGEDHHPDLEVGYNRCLVRYSTHTVGGLSENDFICAARIDALLPEPD